MRYIPYIDQNINTIPSFPAFNVQHKHSDGKEKRESH